MKNRMEENLGGDIDLLHVEIKPNEIVCFYQNDEMIGNASGNGNVWLSYDKRGGKVRIERIYVPQLEN